MCRFRYLTATISLLLGGLFFMPLLLRAAKADSGDSLLLLLSAAPTPTPCPPPGAPPITWEPGKSIGSICLGDSFAVVKCKMGAPTEVRRTSNSYDSGFTMWSDYDTVRLTVSYQDRNSDGQLNDDEQADGIHADPLTAPPKGWYAQPWNYQGVRMLSSTYSATVAVLGPPQDSYENSHWWYNRGVNLYFHSEKGYLSTIYVFAPHTSKRAASPDFEILMERADAFRANVEADRLSVK